MILAKEPMWEGSWRAGVASLATLPHPVTAVWAWGGGTARGAVTAALKFPVGVVEAVHHTHTDTHRICVSGIPRTAVPMEWPDFKLYLPQVFPGKSYINNELNECSLCFLVFPRNGKAAPASHEEEEIFMTGQFQKSLAELDADLEGKHRPSCLDVSAGARHPEGCQGC